MDPPSHRIGGFFFLVYIPSVSALPTGLQFRAPKLDILSGPYVLVLSGWARGLLVGYLSYASSLEGSSWVEVSLSGRFPHKRTPGIQPVDKKNMRCNSWDTVQEDSGNTRLYLQRRYKEDISSQSGRKEPKSKMQRHYLQDAPEPSLQRDPRHRQPEYCPIPLILSP